jgi:hypothetical protein
MTDEPKRILDRNRIKKAARGARRDDSATDALINALCDEIDRVLNGILDRAPYELLEYAGAALLERAQAARAKEEANIEPDPLIETPPVIMVLRGSGYQGMTEVIRVFLIDRGATIMTAQQGRILASIPAARVDECLKYAEQYNWRWDRELTGGPNPPMAPF